MESIKTYLVHRIGNNILYSKDVWIHEVAAETMDRALQAMIISQYRKKIALSNGVWLKPVVMFKSRLIADSNAFFDEYNLMHQITNNQ